MRLALGWSLFYLLFVVPWVTTPWMAARKNRNPAAWFVAAFFFGVFALVAISIAREGRSIDRYAERPDWWGDLRDHH